MSQQTMNSWKGSSRLPSASHISSIWKYGWHPALSSFFTSALAAASPVAAYCFSAQTG